MRLTPLLPMMLALQGLEALGRQAQQAATPGAEMQPGGAAAPGNEVGMPGGGAQDPLAGLDLNHGAPALDLNGMGGVQQANGVGEPSAVSPTQESNGATDDGAQTTFGPQLLEMLEFMRKCVDVLEKLRAATQGGAGGEQGGGAPAGAGGGAPAGGASPSAGAAAAQPGAQPQPVSQPQAPSQAQPQPQPAGQADAQSAPQQAAVAPQTSPQPPAQTSASEPAAAKPGSAVASSTSPEGTQKYTLDGGGSYTHHLENNTGKDMDVAYFKNNGPGMQPGFSGESLKVHLKAGEKADVSIPDDWQGRAQKYGGKMDDPATWAEFNNEPADASKGRDQAKTWFDVSKIPGGNANLTMTTGDGVTAGSDHSMLEAAKKDDRAANLLTKDAAGNDVFKPAQGFDGKTNKDVVDFFTEYEPEKKQDIGGNAKGKFDSYILPNNDSATRVSQSKEMTLSFKDL